MKRSTIFISILAISNSTPGYAAAPTITFGPSTNYQKPPVETGNPTGDGFVITPEDLSKGVPPNGLDLFFGPGLQAKLSKTLNDVCTGGIGQDCANALAEDMDVKQAIMPRNPSFAVAGLVGSLAILVGFWELHSSANQPKKISPHFHLEASDVSLLQAQTASSVVFETAKGAPVVTITPTPTPQAPPATATVLSADKDGYHKGDVLVSLPSQPASLLKQLISQTGHCKAARRRRRRNGPNLVEITNVAIFVLPNAAPHQILNGFGIHNIPQQLLHFRDDATQKALESVQAAAAKLPEFAGVVAGVTKSVASYVFAAAYSVCADHATVLEQIAIESSLVSEDPAGDDENDDKCSKDIKNAPACDDPSCSGKDGQCQQDKLKGCQCLETIEVYSQQGTKKDWDEAQKYLKRVVEGVDSELEGPKCDADSRITLETAAFTALAAKFCKDSVSGPDTAKDITPADAGIKGYDGYRFSSNWEKTNGTCSSSCIDMFSSFTSSSVCSYDSHTKAASGSQKFSCGTASYDFSDGKNKPSSTTTYVNQGNLACGKEQDMGNPNHYVSLDTMNDAIGLFCTRHMWSRSPRFRPGKVSHKDQHVEMSYNNHENDPVYIAMDWADNPGCPTTDFAKPATLGICKDRFDTIVNNCDTKNDNGLNYWKQGGTFFRDCITWTIRRDSFTTPPTDKDDWRPTSKPCTKSKDCPSCQDPNSKDVLAFVNGIKKGTCKTDRDNSIQGWCTCPNGWKTIGPRPSK